ncbi:WD40/YVTN/BNR-like repeat-containing protein [Desulfomicrobium salsuginis]
MLLLAAFLASGATRCSAGEGPRITQLAALEGGQVLVLTTEKGGVYLAQRQGWRRADGAPELYVHRAAASRGGRVYLATSQGLYVFRNGVWDKAAEGAFAGFFPGADGGQALLHFWGLGLHILDARGMTQESLQLLREASAREEALVREEEDLRRQMALLPRGDAATLDEKRAVMRVYQQWQDVQRRLEEAAGQARAGEPRPVTEGLPEDAYVSGAARYGDGWVVGVFGHGTFGLSADRRRWEPLGHGLPGPWVLAVEAAPWGGVYAGLYGAGLHVLAPGATVWERVAGVPDDSTVQGVSFGRAGQVLVATREHGVLFSPDGGRTWPAPGGRPEGNVQGVAVGEDGSLWAGLWEGGLLVSTDDGATWRPCERLEQ